MDLMDLLQGNVPKDLLTTITKQIGAENPKQTAVATQGAVAALTKALANNAAKPEGANALVSALDRDHDGSILDDISGFLGGTRQANNAKMLNGSGILKHVLGGRQSNVIDMISKMSGLDNNKSGSLLAMLAPVIMGALGKTRNQRGLGVGDLVNLLGSTVKTQQKQDKTMGLIGKFLDQDGDGSVMDDIANIGLNFLRRK